MDGNLLAVGAFQHLALIKKGLRQTGAWSFMESASFQHLALIKKGLRPRLNWPYSGHATFQHLALIKKGLRHAPFWFDVGMLYDFSTLP